MTPGDPILHLAGVTRCFGGLTAVKDLSFSVREHEVMGLIGPNGSGKSTTMNMISGALKPSAGEITLDGHSLSRAAAHENARLGVGRTFQLVRALPHLSVRENAMAGAVFGHVRRWGREAEAFADHVLERVGLAGRGGQSVGQLTYIDQKRLELARALAGEPRVLLLDEWLAGLNPSELRDGIDLVADLRAEGRTVILVEHVMDAIRSLCDRCVVIDAGVKIAEGTPEAALADPQVIRAYLGDG